MRQAAVRLTAGVPAQTIDEALERRLAMTLIAANDKLYHLVRNGMPVEFDDANGRRNQGKVICFTDCTKADFLFVTQLGYEARVDSTTRMCRRKGTH